MKGAALTPFLSALDQPLQEEFLDDYLNVIKKSYPAQKDGNVIFHFPRLFFVARKG
jgi:trans-aconitate 2-methyltransferase